MSEASEDVGSQRDGVLKACQQQAASRTCVCANTLSSRGGTRGRGKGEETRRAVVASSRRGKYFQLDALTREKIGLLARVSGRHSLPNSQPLSVALRGSLG